MYRFIVCVVCTNNMATTLHIPSNIGGNNVWTNIWVLRLLGGWGNGFVRIPKMYFWLKFVIFLFVCFFFSTLMAAKTTFMRRFRFTFILKLFFYYSWISSFFFEHSYNMNNFFVLFNFCWQLIVAKCLWKKFFRFFPHSCLAEVSGLCLFSFVRFCCYCFLWMYLKVFHKVFLRNSFIPFLVGIVCVFFFFCVRKSFSS